MRELLYQVLKFLLKGMLSLLILMVLYLVSAIIGSVIPVNKELPEDGEITIFLRTNGVHTSMIFPLEHQVMDWSTLTNPSHTLSGGNEFRYVSFGWGDLEFYKETPEWSDLRFPVAFQAVFLSKPSALHVQFFERIRYDQPTLPVKITREQYQSLSRFVSSSFKLNTAGEPQQVEGLHYDQQDAFYLANRSLHFFYTCNTWVNQGLKRADLPACLWTPFDEGIFYHYR